MVTNSPQLDRVFGALSDATRRDMLAQLSRGETNVSTLAAAYPISRPAISKHLRVLERAGLIERTKQGRESLIRVNPKPAEDARDWIAYYAEFWNQQFDAVAENLKRNKETK